MDLAMILDKFFLIGSSDFIESKLSDKNGKKAL